MTRVVNRFNSEGRFVDFGFLVSHGRLPGENFSDLVQDHFVNGDGLDGYKHVWNFGDHPVVLEEGHLDPTKVADGH